MASAFHALVSFPRAYVAHVLRAPSPVQVSADVTPLWEIAPHFWLHLAVFTALFLALNAFVVPRALAALWPGWAQLSAETRSTASTYLSALVHHAVVVPFAIAAIAIEFLGGGTPPPSWYTVVAPFSTAYLLADTLYTSIPDALKGDMQYLAHHTLGLALCFGAMSMPVSVMRWAPHVLLCEASTFGLFAVWLLGKSSRESRSYLLSLAFFFVSFTLTRVVNLPLVVFAVLIVNPADAAALGTSGAVVLIAIVAMQIFWWSKMWIMLLKAGGCMRSSGGAGDKRTGAAPAAASPITDPVAPLKHTPVVPNSLKHAGSPTRPLPAKPLGPKAARD